MPLIEIAPQNVTPQLRALFDPSDPSPVRGFAVLDGQALGRIFTDDPDQPTWGYAWEITEGTLYPRGAVTQAVFAEVIPELRKTGDVLIGLWEDDPRFDLLPPAPEYDGFTLDFQDRPIGRGLEPYLNVPDGCHIQPVDAALFERCNNRDYYVTTFGSADRALEKIIGVCLMRGETILSEAFAGFMANGVYELGADTHEPHQGHGYATITCAHLIQTCEGRGYDTYWNCAAGNTASAALARKLGYRRERRYRLVAWGKR